MQLKHKIVALGILPLLLAMGLICVLVFVQNQQLGRQQAEVMESAILSSKRSELKNYVALARRVIQPILADPALSPDQAREQAFQALQHLDFGEDGYFFIYDLRGRNLMHPRQPDLVDQDLWDMTDPDGLKVVQALIHSASHGDGFQRYAWRKPSTTEVTAKLAYVELLAPQGWVLGTGLYLEDVDQALRQVRTEVAAGIHTTMLAIGAIALGAILLVFLAGLALNVREHRLADSKLKALNRRIIDLQEEERSRVSRELHDGISQLLVSIKFQFELAGHQLAAGRDAAAETLEQATLRLGEAIGEIRRISHDLHPSLLDTLGLPAALLQLTGDFEKRCGLQVDYCNEMDAVPLPDPVAVALYRIVQEALTNIERHAGADRVRVSLSPRPQAIRLLVEDNGAGFDPQAIEGTQEGIGLRNIRERIEYLGGELRLSSAPGRTRIRVILPLPPP